MLALTPISVRPAVAFFNMKSFCSRKKFEVNPQNIKEVFSRCLDPQDCLLRQSRVGIGSTRLLVLDKRQKVKGVYHPLLCLPHPSTVSGGDNVLGLPICDYLKVLDSGLPVKAGSGRPIQPPSVLVALSHPAGVGVCTYGADGSARMEFQNVSISFGTADSYRGGNGRSSGMLVPDTHSIASVQRFIDALNSRYEQFVSTCSTFYFVVRDNTASLTLDTLQRMEKRQHLDAEEEGRDDSSGRNTPGEDMHGSKVSFLDNRWVSLPESVLQLSRDTPLYTRDETTHGRIVSAAGLCAAVGRGMLDLDHVPNSMPPS